jgi:hypothetical protein
VRDWPLLLVASVLLLSGAARYVVADESSDILSGILVCLASAAFGAWLYSLGQQAAESIRDNVRNMKEKPRDSA